ncbi:hypothetical protein L211DRAFT_851814 [Terfezia boudieri ATCC MYA-4762]|uniref:Uncharacterized protein n=1 Tax=Terfezia boudieri ATCC MYA-4762 TaxID=1051890 RepID=A0A3N4LDW0_9PEZI|nr:hypothetical protein L211DRAFT_851814 [Terfezia boudieri ATCC MYA-4762]
MSSIRAIRSPSPASFATATTPFAQMNQSVQRVNHSALAASLNEVIDLIPTSYRESLHSFLEYLEDSREGMDIDTGIGALDQTSTAKEFPAGVEVKVLAFRMEMLSQAITAREQEVTFLHTGLRHPAIQKTVVNIIDQRYEELDIFTYATRVVDIAGSKAIAELETALNKMKLKDAVKDPQQGPAITQDSLADTVRKAVQDALRKEKGTNPLQGLKHSLSNSNCITYRFKEKRQRKRQIAGQVCEERSLKNFKREEEETSQLHRRYLSDEGKEDKESEEDSKGMWTWSNPLSYPDRLLNIPFNCVSIIEIMIRKESRRRLM